MLRCIVNNELEGHPRRVLEDVTALCDICQSANLAGGGGLSTGAVDGLTAGGRGIDNAWVLLLLTALWILPY